MKTAAFAKVEDEVTQRAEWRARLITDVLGRKFDDATLEAMLDAGLSQAHSEGLQDAAAVCQGVADTISEPQRKHAAKVLARSIRDLDVLNKRTDVKP